MTLRQGPGKDKSVQNPGSATRGPAVVVAPLIALQKNQLDGLRWEAKQPSLSTELDGLTCAMAESSDWSDYHQADEQFHQLAGRASGMGTAVELYHQKLAELYSYFIPYPIERPHKSSCDHVALVAALRSGHGDEAVEIARNHVDIPHRTMFMGLTDGGGGTTSA